MEAKNHLRVSGTDEDGTIAAILTAAWKYCEEVLLHRALLPQTWDLWLDEFPDEDYIEIPRPPLQSITSIKYYGTDDTEYTMTATDYFVDTKSEPGRVSLAYGKTWPSTVLRPINGVVVRFVAGYTGYSGTVTTAGTAVTKASGDNFNTAWTPGKTIVINDVVYRIASVGSTSALTLAATAGTQGTAVAYSTNDVPEPIKQMILLLLGDWYENRENSGTIPQQIQFAVNALATAYKVWWL